MNGQSAAVLLAFAAMALAAPGARAQFDCSGWPDAVAGWERGQVLRCVAAGVDPDIVDNSGETPLHYAVRDELLEIVEALLEAGADPNVADGNGQTPLHFAAWLSPNIEIVEALLGGGADPDIANRFGTTPLHYVAYRNLEIVEALLGAGADPHVANEDGQTPLGLAMATDNSEIAEAMLTADSGDGGNASPSPVAARSGNPAVAAAPVEVEAGSVNGNDRTPLHDAVLDQDVEVVEALLAAGADPNGRSGPFGITPLHAAAENGNLELVGMLLAAGADPEARLSVETPLDFAERQGHSAVVSLLREAVAVIGPVGGGGGNEVGGPSTAPGDGGGASPVAVSGPQSSMAAAEPVEVVSDPGPDTGADAGAMRNIGGTLRRVADVFGRFAGLAARLSGNLGDGSDFGGRLSGIADEFGDFADMAGLLAAVADPGTGGGFGATLRRLAREHLTSELMAELTGAGIDPDAVAELIDAGIGAVAAAGLMEAGAEPGDRTDFGGTLLGIAVERGRSAVAEELLEAGVDPAVMAALLGGDAGTVTGMRPVAAQCAPDGADRYGSIAFSQRPDGGHAWGIAWAFEDQTTASNTAIVECRLAGDDGTLEPSSLAYRNRDCRVVGTFRNACGALAVDGGNGFGAGWGDSVALAERDAVRKCGILNEGCSVLISRCAEPARQCAEPEPELVAEDAPADRPAATPGGTGPWQPGQTFSDGPGPEMVVIPAGRFRMGCVSGRYCHDSEVPVRDVTIPRAFAVSRFEVTFAQWDACVQGGGCGSHAVDEGWGRGNRPVIRVTWYDAQAYVAWLSRQTGQTYRLLSESEWEYVARAGRSTAYSWGDDIGSNRANCGDSEEFGTCGDRWEYTAPVGSFAANAFGVHDMHGNVFEWVEDCWNEDYAGAPSDGGAWRSGDCEYRVARGGSWGVDPRNLRSALRYGPVARLWNHNVGFRVARTLTP